MTLSAENFAKYTVEFVGPNAVTGILYLGTREYENGLKAPKALVMVGATIAKIGIDVYRDSLLDIAPNQNLSWLDSIKANGASLLVSTSSALVAAYQCYHLFFSGEGYNSISDAVKITPMAMAAAIGFFYLYEHPGIISYIASHFIDSSPCFKPGPETQLLTKNIILVGYKEVNYKDLGGLTVCLDDEAKSIWMKLALDKENNGTQYEFINNNSKGGIYYDKVWCPSGTIDVNEFLVSNAYHYENLLNIHYAISNSSYDICVDGPGCYDC